MKTYPMIAGLALLGLTGCNDIQSVRHTYRGFVTEWQADQETGRDRLNLLERAQQQYGAAADSTSQSIAAVILEKKRKDVYNEMQVRSFAYWTEQNQQ